MYVEISEVHYTITTTKILSLVVYLPLTVNEYTVMMIGSPVFHVIRDSKVIHWEIKYTVC